MLKNVEFCEQYARVPYLGDSFSGIGHCATFTFRVAFPPWAIGALWTGARRGHRLRTAQIDMHSSML